jgi:hypothetical protein
MTVYQYINKETDPEKLYPGIRAMLTKMAERGTYPEDHVIKKIQRLADKRYVEIGGK